MAKGDHSNAQHAVDDMFTGMFPTNQNMINSSQSLFDNAVPLTNQVSSDIRNSYNNIINDPTRGNVQGAMSLPDLQDLFKNVGGVSGGIDQANIDALTSGNAYKGFQGLSQGLSPSFTSSLQPYQGAADDAIAGYKKLGETGGVSDEEASNFLGNGSYQDFINTGGLSPQAVQNIRARSLSPLYSTYANAQADLDRSRTLSGGNMANFGAASAKMNRDLGFEAAKASNDTEANLAEEIRAGKQFGATGLTNAQASLTAAKNQGKEAGLSGEANTAIAQQNAKIAVEQLDAQMKESGLAGMSDLEKAQVQAELVNAQINESASAANAQIGLAKASGMAGLQMQGVQNQLGATQGMNTFLGTRPGQLQQAIDFRLSSGNAMQNMYDSLIQGRLGTANVPGNFASAMGNIGSVIGLGSQIAGAGSGAFTRNTGPSLSSTNIPQGFSMLPNVDPRMSF
jgi:archaellum component FlaG (FlaF/FlaG flagellin family)